MLLPCEKKYSLVYLEIYNINVRKLIKNCFTLRNLLCIILSEQCMILFNLCASINTISNKIIKKDGNTYEKNQDHLHARSRHR